jgi:hypothetical protein
LSVETEFYLLQCDQSDKRVQEFLAATRDSSKDIKARQLPQLYLMSHVNRRKVILEQELRLLVKNTSHNLENEQEIGLVSLNLFELYISQEINLLRCRELLNLMESLKIVEDNQW